MSKINLHSAIKNSYAPREQQKNAFKNEGFVYDSDLSNHNEQVYYNPTQKKLLYTVAGTHNLRDWGTDSWLAFGNLKGTDRYKEAKNVLEKAKKRYNPKETTVAGHSLGGSVSQYIASPTDKVFTLDKGATFGQKTRGNETAYRTSGDLVSALNANSTRMTTLKNNNLIHKTPLKYFSPSARLADAYYAHDVDNIKKSGIFI
jgi:hypothetical protein